MLEPTHPHVRKMGLAAMPPTLAEIHRCSAGIAPHLDPDLRLPRVGRGKTVHTRQVSSYMRSFPASTRESELGGWAYAD